MKAKRWLAMLLTLGMLASVLAGCGSKNADQPGTPDPGTPQESPAAVSEPGTADIGEVTGDALTSSTDSHGNIIISTNDAEPYVRKTEAGTLTVGVTSNAYGFDPTNSQGIGQWLVYNQVFTRDEDGNIQGELAESWEYVDDCTLKIKLHEGVMFSNGEELVAEDVLYSLSRFAEVGSRWTSYWSLIDFDASYCEDDYTVVLVTSEVFAALPGYLTLRQASIVNKEWCEGAAEEDWWENPCGTGPYTCVENVSGAHTTYAANENYWDGTPEYTRITVNYYSEATTMFVDYQNGVLDVAYNISSNDLERVKNGDVANTTCVLQNDASKYVFYLPENDGVFSDIRVRQAFSYAIDMNEISVAALGNLCAPTDNMNIATTPIKIDAAATVEYDPQKAMELLAEAGYADGFELNVIITADNVTRAFAETVQAYLDLVGIKMNIEEMDVVSAIGQYQQGNSAFVINNLTNPVLDPDMFLDTYGIHYSSNKQYTYSNQVMNDAFEAARATLDDGQRAELYTKGFQALFDEYWIIPICSVTYGFVQRDYVSSAVQIENTYPDLSRIHMQ